MITSYIKIHINKEYQNLIPSQSEQEYQSLKASIKANGFWISNPIVVNKEGIILDGHHRYRACKELQVEPSTTTAQLFHDRLDEKLYIINNNLTKRQLNSFQRIELALKSKPILQEIAKRHESLAGKGVEIQTPLGRIDQQIGKHAGLGKDTVRKVEVIIEQARSEILEKAKQGKLSIDKAYRIVQKEQRRDERIKEAENLVRIENESLAVPFRLIHSDFKRTELNESSIDLIFTDPPYEDKWLPNYSDLAVLAAITLVQNGSLVTYCNQTQLPQIMQYMQNMGLTYWHTIAVILENTFARNFPRRIVYKYKPLLWFVKGKRAKDSDFLSDVIYSKKPLKDKHPWQQSNVEAEHVISRLTTEGQTILDPMMGTGTTGITTLKLNRKFIGIEINPETFELAKAKLSL